MIIRTGLENRVEGDVIAWALDFPGCFATGRDAAEAITRLPLALVALEERIRQRAAVPWLELGNFDVRLVEVFDDYQVDKAYEKASEGYVVEAFFQQEWQPLTIEDVEQDVQLLGWARADLLEVCGELSPEQLSQERTGERWSINGILRHLANAEWWYMERLGLEGVPVSQLPQKPFERLEAVRARLCEVLPGLAGVELVRGKQGELWSPRKLLRRALWHEYDHIGHISRLILED